MRNTWFPGHSYDEMALIIDRFCCVLLAREGEKCTWVRGKCESSKPLQCLCEAALPHLDGDLSAGTRVHSPTLCFETPQTLFHVSRTEMHFAFTDFYHLLVSMPNASSFPLCPPLFLSLLTFWLPLCLPSFWRPPAELNIAAASLSESADYIKSASVCSIQLQMAHPS